MDTGLTANDAELCSFFFEGVVSVRNFEQPAVDGRGPWSNGRGVPSDSARAGVVLIATVVCLLLTTTLLASMLKSAARRTRQTRQTVMRVQTEWLAESGAERAVWQLRTQPQYSGEIWRIPAAKLGGRYAGEVRIGVQPLSDDATQLQMTVTAVCTTDGKQRIQRTRRWLVPRSNPE